MRRSLLLALTAFLVLVLNVVSAAPPVTSGFTYQGFLKDGALPANGNYDFEFRLFDALTGGAQVGGTVTLDDVFVTDGLFDVELDFGSGVFDGQARWIAVSVRDGASADPYTPLTPRRPLTAVPYAQYALDGPGGGDGDLQRGQVAFSVQPGMLAKTVMDTVTFDTPFASNPIVTTGLQATTPLPAGTTASVQNVSPTGFTSIVSVPPGERFIVSPDSGVSAATAVHVSLAVVNGHPAISYSRNFDLYYVRALDVDGLTWGTPVLVDATGNTGLFSSLAVVDGNPAISYYDSTATDFKYVRSLDTTGAAWNSPVTIESAAGSYTSLEIINGNPAVGYSSGGLKFKRASDSTGATWPAAATTVATGTARHVSLESVNGNPAIVYSNSINVFYARATNANGTTWGSSVPLGYSGPYLLASSPEDTLSGSLEIIDGKPAVSLIMTHLIVPSGSASPEYWNTSLSYTQSSSVNGDSGTWSLPIILDTHDFSIPTSNPPYFPFSPSSLVSVDGKPAITYGVKNMRSETLRYVQATSVAGTVWSAPVDIDTVTLTNFNAAYTGRVSSLAEVNGKPAVGYAPYQLPDTVRYFSVKPLNNPTFNWMATEP